MKNFKEFLSESKNTYFLKINFRNRLENDKINDVLKDLEDFGDLKDFRTQGKTIHAAIVVDMDDYSSVDDLADNLDTFGNTASLEIKDSKNKKVY